MNPKRAILGIAALLVLLGGAVLVARLPREQAAQHWTLPGGRELTFLKVTYGPKHEARYGNRWQDYFGAILSTNLQKKLGSRVATYKPGDTNAIVVWMKETGLPSPSGMRMSDAILTVADANGTESASQYSRFISSSMATNGEAVFNWELTNYPRRSADLKIIIYSRVIPNGGQMTRVGEVKIPNPARKTVSQEWSAETLPAKRNTNGLEISLLGLETGLTETEARMGFGAENARIISRAAFYLRENGLKTTNWSIAKVHPSAATGESFEPTTYGGGWEWAEIPFQFQGALWTEEPAWKIKTELWRTGDFPVQELWTIKNIAIPDRREVTEVNAKTNIYGAEVELLGVMSAGAPFPKGWNRMGFGGPVALHVILDTHPADIHLTWVEARDDQGRAVQIQSSGYSGDGTNKMHYGFGLKFADDAKTMDVTLAVSKAITVEFLVKPKLYKPGPR